LRVDDYVLKTIGFIGRVHRFRTDTMELEPLGTGFFVSITSSPTGMMFHCFVTARHVVESLRGDSAYVALNRKEGGHEIVPLAPSIKWWFHPTDSSVDVAVLLFPAHPKQDMVSVGTDNMFLTAENRKKYKIGVGDEVFMVGLFTYVPGEERVSPIVRHGNIAMLPDGPIQTNEGFMDAYLVEARSIGGLSGPPVFVRETVSMDAFDAAGQKMVVGVFGRLQLLGMCIGHWDIAPTDKNRAWPAPQELGVNMGIGLVTPAPRILEVINQPELVAMRDRAEESQLKRLVLPIVKDTAGASHGRFRGLAGKELAVPREEILKREVKFKAERSSRPNRGRQPKS
jgi:hypothetical protein